MRVGRSEHASSTHRAALVRNAVLLLATLIACREIATSRRRAGSEPSRRYGLRQDAVGCFKASFPRVGHEYTGGPRLFRLDSLSVASVSVGWRSHPGFRAARPAAWDVNREDDTRYLWSADSLTDSIRVFLPGLAWEQFVFEMGTRDTFGGIETHGGDIPGPSGEWEWSKPTIVTRVNCHDYAWSLMRDSEYPLCRRGGCRAR